MLAPESIACPICKRDHGRIVQVRRHCRKGEGSGCRYYECPECHHCTMVFAKAERTLLGHAMRWFVYKSWELKVEETPGGKS